MRAHLQGGVPVTEVEAKRPLFDALGFDRDHAFVRREHDNAYLDFSCHARSPRRHSSDG